MGTTVQRKLLRMELSYCATGTNFGGIQKARAEILPVRTRIVPKRNHSASKLTVDWPQRRAYDVFLPLSEIDTVEIWSSSTRVPIPAVTGVFRLTT